MNALGLTPSSSSLVNELQRFMARIPMGDEYQPPSMSTYVHIRVGRRSKDTVPYLGQKMIAALGSQGDSRVDYGKRSSNLH